MNLVTFGVEIDRAGGGGARTGGLPPGIGIFYDRGKLAVRIAGGRDDTYKSGEMLRVSPETAWPSDGWVEIRITREDADAGKLAVYLDTNLDDGLEGMKIAEDTIGVFKGRGRGKARLAILGWSTQAQAFKIEVGEIRIVRRK